VQCLDDAKAVSVAFKIRHLKRKKACGTETVSHNELVQYNSRPCSAPDRGLPLLPRSTTKLNWRQREIDISPVSSAEVKEAWCFFSTSPYIFMYRGLDTGTNSLLTLLEYQHATGSSVKN